MKKSSIFMRESSDYCTERDRRFLVEMPEDMDAEGAAVRLIERRHEAVGKWRLEPVAETTAEKWNRAVSAVSWRFERHPLHSEQHAGMSLGQGVPAGARIGRTSFWLGDVFGRELAALFWALGPARVDEADSVAGAWCAQYGPDEIFSMYRRRRIARGERQGTWDILLFGMFSGGSPRIRLDEGRR